MSIRKNLKIIAKGFTLIELLVVIAIIGILATIVLVALNNSRMRARDSRRLQDMQQISTAMELYYYTNDSSYADPNNGSSWSDKFNGAAKCSGQISKGSTVLLNNIPNDPGGSQYYCSDAGDNTGQTYCAWVQKETDSKFIIANKLGVKEVTTNPNTGGSGGTCYPSP